MDVEEYARNKKVSCRLEIATVRGKILDWEKLVNLANRMPFANFLPASYFFLQSVVAIHAAHSLVFYPSISIVSN